MPDPDPLILASILYLVYYFGLSLYLSGKLLEAQRLEEETAEVKVLRAEDTSVCMVPSQGL